MNAKHALVGAVSFAVGVAAVAGCFSLKDDAPSFAGGDSSIPDAAPAPNMQSDFYVDPTGALDGSYPTITAALAAAADSGAAARTVHVATGTYRDESLPLTLRDGVSLEGAGSDGGTVIVGAGLTEIAPPPVSNASVSATLVVGDTSRITRIAHLELRSPDAPDASDGLEAIVCDRGSADGDGGAPNTLVDDVVIEGYDVGVRALGTLPGKGCGARVTRSVIESGHHGAIAKGSATAAGDPAYVTLELGDGSDAGGNVVQHLRLNAGSTDPSGAAVWLYDHVVGAVIVGNQLSDMEVGIEVRSGGGAPPKNIRIEHNELRSMQNVGVHLLDDVVIEKLEGNTFRGIVRPGISFPAVGVIAATSNSTAALPAIHSARGNTFVGNQIGVQIFTHPARTTPLTAEEAASIDFGTASSPGRNVFRCNSANHAAQATVGTTLGGDVYATFPATSPELLHFASNTWDHVPVATESGFDSSTMGIDLLVNGITVDVTGAVADSSPCPPPFQP